METFTFVIITSPLRWAFAWYWYHFPVSFTDTRTEHVLTTAHIAAPINKENICNNWCVTYSPSSDSLSESWLMMSFLWSSACSRAAWSFLGNSEASSSIYKQLKTLQSPAINNSDWRATFKGSDLQHRTACFTSHLKRNCETTQSSQPLQPTHRLTLSSSEAYVPLFCCFFFSV